MGGVLDHYLALTLSTCPPPLTAPTPRGKACPSLSLVAVAEHGRTRTRWFSSDGESRARYSLTEPIPLQVEHVAVEFIVEPFCSLGPSLRTMKTYAQ